MTSQVLVQKKKRGRPRLSDSLIQFRLPKRDSQLLTMLLMFEDRDKAEIFRGLFLQLKRSYRKDKAFHRWADKNREKLKVEEFIDVDEVLP